MIEGIAIPRTWMSKPSKMTAIAARSVMAFWYAVHDPALAVVS